MEADSTTFDESSKVNLPFVVSPGNLKVYSILSNNDTEKPIESQIVMKLQDFGLLPKTIRCSTNQPDCRMICKTARVIDRVQWCCEGCGKRQPIRYGSFFLRLQCSLLQALQMILAWCEDAECSMVAESFGVKQKVALTIYDKLDELAVKEHDQTKLGGENSVVLAEMYPDCLNWLSPDTTDQPHVHRVLMLADTKHIPTHYKLHVIQDGLKKQHGSSMDSQSLQREIEEVLSRVVDPESLIVTSSNVPPIEGAASIHQLAQHCDADMMQFLSSRIWRQAVSLCSASRELCAPGASPPCGAAQAYLRAALYRLRHGDGFFRHMLGVIARHSHDS